jgi:uncharacterized protein YdeI (YjbR/CyaY-like superfamily)
MNIDDALVVTSRAEWRSWLEAHHAARTEVWLVFRRRGMGTRAVEYDGAVEEAICFGWHDTLQQRIDDEQYAIQFVPRPPSKRWTQDDLAPALRLRHEGRMADAGVAALPQ